MKANEYLDKIDRAAFKYKDGFTKHELYTLRDDFETFSEKVKHRDWGSALLYSYRMGKTCGILGMGETDFNDKDWGEICERDLVMFLLNAEKAENAEKAD